MVDWSSGADRCVHLAELQGGLRSDFAFDVTTTGLGADELIGVVDVDYTTVRISYNPALIPDHPTLGAFDEAMIVRSTAGFPATNLDGVTIVRTLDVDPVLDGGYASVVDKELLGRTVVLLRAVRSLRRSSGWFKVGEQAWLNPGEYGYAERIWQNFPDYYRRIDSGVWLVPRCAASAVQRHRLRVRHPTHLGGDGRRRVGLREALGQAPARGRCGAGAAQGVVANGDRRLRTLVGNLMALRKKKGTKDGTEGYVGALTGYPTRVYEGAQPDAPAAARRVAEQLPGTGRFRFGDGRQPPGVGVQLRRHQPGSSPVRSRLAARVRRAVRRSVWPTDRSISAHQQHWRRQR